MYTATEAANAIEELAKAGLGTADVLSGALAGSLDLAASGQLSVARAAEITGISLKQFKLDGDQAGRVADVLSAGANKAVGSVEDLAQGLKFVGPVAASMNVSLEDTVATLALFADQGLIGEQAGTSLRGMLSSLTSPSKAADAELRRLNVTLYDGNDRFIGLENVAGQLHGTLSGLTDAERDLSLGIIFGNQQVTAARVLVQSGATAWRDYRAAVDDSGIAARIAAQRMDNLNGDIEKLGGALDTALIKTGSGANDVLRALVQSGTFLADVVGGLPEPLLAAGLAVGVVAASTALAGGAALLAVPKWTAFKTALKDTGISAGATAGKIGLVGGAVGVATLVIGAFIQANAAAAARTDSFRESLDAATGATTEYTRDLVVKQLTEQRAFESAAKAGISQRELTDAVLEGGDALVRIKERLAAATTGGEGFKNLWDGASFAIVQTQGDLERISGSLVQAKKDFVNSKAATEDNTDALDEFGDAATEVRDDVDDLADAIRNFGAEQFDLREANRQVEQSLADLRASLAENGNTFDITTQAGRDNQDALDEVAESYLNVAAATAVQARSAEAAIPVIEAGRAAFIAQAEAAGIGADEANRLADELGLIPSSVTAVVTVDTSAAQRTLDAFRSQPLNLIAYIRSVDGNETGGFYQRGVRAFAAGGTSFPSGVYAGGQNIHKFAETGLPWETYISPKPGHERENIGYALESLSRLGAFDDVSAPGSSPQFSVIVEPKGGVDLLKYVDVRIQEKDTADWQTTIGRVYR